MFCQLHLISKKGPNAKKCAKKMQKIIKYWKTFPCSFRSLGIWQNSYFWSSLPPCPSSICKTCFFFFFLSSHHDTNPLLHFYHFRKKYNYILANINSESSWVIFFLFFFVFIRWVKHFYIPAKFVTIWSTVLNTKKIFIYNLCFGLSKVYTNIQQDQKGKLDYRMSVLRI